MANIDDYIGRTVDIAAFEPPDVRGEMQQRMAAPAASGLLVTGVQKLAQRALIELLTAKGSMPYAPNRGTSLISSARQGGLLSEADVLAAASAALGELESNLIAEETDTEPADERYGSVTVIGVESQLGEAVLRLSVVSQAGTEVELIAPLPITVNRQLV